MELNPYATYLEGQDPIRVLFTSADRLRGLTISLSPEQIEQPTAPGKWSIREIVAHMADCEIAFSFRFRQTLAPAPDEPHAILQPFDQDAWAQHYSAYDLTSGLDLFQSARNWNLHLFGTLTEADRHRPATHPERGTMTFWTIVETLAGHDLHHLQHLERITTDLTAAG